MKEAFNYSTEELMEILNSSPIGLKKDQVEESRKKYGVNELQEESKKSIFSVFIEQFKDVLVIILLIAASVSVFLGDVESSLVIFAVVAINAILGTVQHVKAEQSLSSLKALSAPMTKVLRNGEKLEIPSKEVVVGDIVYLEAGDYISADGRIIENFSIQVNESSLTGESEAVIKNTEILTEKNIPIGDRKNMVFSGSLVTYGRATVLITKVGMDTEIGKVAQLLKDTKEKKTPLQINIDNFGKKLAVVILAVCAIVFALNMYRGANLMDSFMFGVALAVAAIPEALSSIVTIVLSLGTQKMAKENAIIRKLQAVEGLGSVSIICSDKTGTLTQNKMTVKKIYVDDNIIESGSLNFKNDMHQSILLMSILCNDASNIDGNEIGDPTEVALVNLGNTFSINSMDKRNIYARIGEIPFDSDRKLMSTVNKFDDKNIMITKGAVDVLLNRVKKIQTTNGLISLEQSNIERIQRVNEEFSRSGLRVLAFAYKEVGQDVDINLDDENDLIFIGLIAMMDPPREESKKAVEDCINAGIKPIMITGDHKITAAAIAKEIGILKNDAEAIEGSEIEDLSDEQLRNLVEKVSVYARVSPEHKIRIVRAWQDKGNIVAMTGDGVNDAPALKQADIGVAMGITGSEVAKDAASMVLTDDNFATIVKAVKNGRNIYANIKNSIKFLLSGNTAGILSVLYASLMALPVPFQAVHLLFINLLTDSLPAIALGLEPHNNDVMKEKPRSKNESILTKDFAIEVLLEGIIIAVVTMIGFHIGLKSGGPAVGSSMAFAILCLARLFHGFNCKSKKAVIFSRKIFANKYLWMAFGIGFLLLNLVLLIDPLAYVFKVADINLQQLLTIYGLAIIPLIFIQSIKALIYRENSKEMIKSKSEGIAA